MKSFLKILLLSFVVALPSSANAGLYDDLQQPDRCHSFIGHALDQSLASHAAYVGGGAYDYTLIGDSGAPYDDYNTAITTGWNDLRTPPDYATIIDFWFGIGTFYVDGNGDGACWDYYEVIPTALERLDRDIDPRMATLESDVLTLDSGKVDKVSGKNLSQEDFTTTLKGKLDGIANGATANQTDAHLLNRSNHTGTQAQSTVTDLTTDLAALSARIDALETWKGLMPKKVKVFTATTDANGDVTIDLTSGSFSEVPAIGATYVFNNNNYGTHYNIKAISTTSISLRVMRNKETSVLLGGSIDPDEPLASTSIRIIATEY